MGNEREPSIISPAADTVVGFLVGFFGTLWGMFMTTLVVYIWAGGGLPEERTDRRRHAKKVAIASGVGFLSLVVLVLLLFAYASANHETVF